jgi:predicted metal-dependent TIM-barrel fold hydrolase
VLIDHCEEHTIRLAKEAGFWCGLTIYPVTKVTPQRGADILETYGTDMIMVNSAADWGESSPSMMIDTCLEYRRRCHSADEAEKIFYENPCRFFSQSPKWRLRL